MGFTVLCTLLKLLHPPNLTRKLLVTWGIFGEGGNLIKYIIKCNMILCCKRLKNRVSATFFFPEVQFLYNPSPHSPFFQQSALLGT